MRPRRTAAASSSTGGDGGPFWTGARWPPPREYALLSVFAEHPGATLTREELYELAWGRPPDSGSIKALSVTIARLRRKLGDSFPIASLYGFGYRYDPIE